jgi:photosystem II stability/assembly factor-like uncharacterized protein
MPLRFALLLIPFALMSLSGQDATPEAAPRGRRAAEIHFFEQRAYPFGRIPQTARLEAIDAMRAMEPTSSLHRAMSWRPIGPFHVAGRVNAIAVHPNDPETLWIGAADGGVWKSTNGGVSWRPVMDDASSLALGAIAVDPENPSVLYAGTGEAAFNVDTYTGAGMYRSSDGGETWHVCGLTTVASFSRIVVLPGRSTVLAAAVRNNGGIYRSTDGGATWSRRIPDAVYDLTVNPSNPDEVWAAGSRHGVLHSTDGGATFQPSGTGIAADGTFPGRGSIQVAPTNPRILYALFNESIFPDTELSRIYKSMNGGATWGLVLDNQPNLLNYYGNFQGSYNNTIAVSPVDPSVVVAGGVILMRTTNGGATWGEVGGAVHPDFHALAFAPSGDHRLYIGNDGGMYSADVNAQVFERINRGLSITQFYAMGIDQRQGDVTYGGTQDNGTLSTTAETFQQGSPGVVSGSDGFHVAVDHTNSDIVYVEHPYGEPFRVDLRTGGSLRITTGLLMTEQAAWSAPLAMNPLDARVLYLGRMRVHRFDARSSRWQPISPRFRSTLSAIGVSPIDTSIIYAATALGELQVTTDAGRTWNEIGIGQGLPDRAATDIAASPIDRCTAFITYSGFYAGHVFRTTDCGATWVDISRGLPDIPANAIVADPTDAKLVYVGTDIGVFVTVDGGASWGPLGTGLPAVVVVDLALHTASRTLRAATHGRSMYEIELGETVPQRAIVAPAGGERWVGGSMRSIVWSGMTEPVRLEYSIDDGATWNEIGASLVGGAYRWRVPDVGSVATRVRATSEADSSVRAVGGAFTIEQYRPGLVIGMAQKPIVCHGLAFDGEALWATSEFGDSLVKIDPTTLSTLDFVRIHDLDRRYYFSDAAFHPGRGTLFIHASDDPFPSEAGHGTLMEVSRDGEILNRWPSPCTLPIGLALVDDASAGLTLLAADFLNDQSLYLIDPATGETVRRIAREKRIEYGPNDMTADRARGVFWQVIADFDLDEGPRGSTAVRMSLDAQDPSCVFSLATSADSTPVIGQWAWGRLHARGIERDPRDDGFWVTNIDGTIFKVTGCSAGTSSAPSDVSESLQLAITSVVPNPSHERARVSIELRRSSSLTVELIDARGRTLLRRERAAAAPGVAVETLELGGVPSGIYTVAVTAGADRVARQLVVIE